MNVKILDSCVGCGACAVINPAVFDMCGNKASVNSINIDETEDLCIDAALSCPVNAIDISDY
ncbi:ferredoxin [bacterium]|nr:ferredoxin [bacterium]